MNKFIVKEIINANIKDEIEKIGFDSAYLPKIVRKYAYKNLKIFGLTPPQASILKQSAISVGADCAVHREVITCGIEKSDCILGGSIDQLFKISQKLRAQPFGLKDLALLIEQNFDFSFSPLEMKGKTFDFNRPYIVGVLNLTQDSFSDGGEFWKFEDACKRLEEMIEEGADVIEIGAESTKPFSRPIADAVQLEKLLPVLNYIKRKQIKTPISVDTRSSVVAQKCLDAGCSMINDVSGFDFDKNMANILAEHDKPVVIQHSKGSPENMQSNPSYENLMDEIFISLKQKIEYALGTGIKKHNIIVDGGIGFGKTKAHNFELFRRIDELFSLGCPVMLGVSRKSLLDMPDETNEIKDIYTLALNSILVEKKINFLRVHNVKLHKKLLEILCGSE